MSYNRHRHRVLEPSFHWGGHADSLAGLPVETQADQPYLIEDMEDVVGNLTSTNMLILHQDDWCLGRFNGQNGTFWNCVDWTQRWDNVASTSGLWDASDDVLGTMALARTNPSAPTVSVWNFLYELKDVPDMLLSVGRYLRKYGPNPSRNWPRIGSDVWKDLGSIYLNWTFGWELYIKDVGRLLDFVGGVEQRQRDLNDLRSGLLKKTVTLSESSGSASGDFYFGPLYQAIGTARAYTRANRKIWARVAYKPTQATYKFIGNDYLSTARRLAFGHDLRIDNVWNAFPWTWLIDWCTTAGDYFTAHRNLLAIECVEVAIMRHTTVGLDRVEFLNNPFNATFTKNGHYGWSQKRRNRWVGSPVIQAYLPNLGGKQLAILAALSTRYLH